MDEEQLVGGGLFEKYVQVATRGVVGCRFRLGCFLVFGAGKRLPKFKS